MTPIISVFAASPDRGRGLAVLLEGDKPWTPDRLLMLEARLRQRLADLASRWRARTGWKGTSALATS